MAFVLFLNLSTICGAYPRHPCWGKFQNQLKDLKEPGSCKQCPQLGSPLAPGRQGRNFFSERVPMVPTGRRRHGGMVAKVGCRVSVSTERFVMGWQVSGQVHLVRLMPSRRRGPSLFAEGHPPSFSISVRFCDGLPQLRAGVSGVCFVFQSPYDFGCLPQTPRLG